MEQKIIYVIAVCFAVVVAFFAAGRARAADMPAAGSKAPDFKLMSQEDKEISLHDFKGQWVVLYFYPKDFTSGCTLEAHGFQADIEKYKARKAVILGVSVDSAGSHKDFCTKEGLNFKLLADTDHQVSEQYGSLTKLGPVAVSTRNTFIVGPDGLIEKIFTGVKPIQHSAEVLAALDELQKGQFKQ